MASLSWSLRALFLCFLIALSIALPGLVTMGATSVAAPINSSGRAFALNVDEWRTCENLDSGTKVLARLAERLPVGLKALLC